MNRIVVVSLTVLELGAGLLTVSTDEAWLY